MASNVALNLNLRWRRVPFFLEYKLRLLFILNIEPLGKQSQVRSLFYDSLIPFECSTFWMTNQFSWQLNNFCLSFSSDISVSSSICQNLRTYHSIFLLNRMSNMVYCGLIIPVWKWAVVVIVGVAAAVLIQRFPELDIISLTIAVCAVITAPFFIMAPSAFIMSRIYHKSRLFFRKMKIRITTTEDSTGRSCDLRRLTSMQPLRCQVGNFYSMEACAQLTLADTAIHAVVFLLLVVKWDGAVLSRKFYRLG